MKKVAFFFGAGAEGEHNFGISTGCHYLQSSLYASETLKGFDEALSSFFENKKFFDGKFTYRKDTLDVSTFILKNFVIQKATSDCNYFSKHQETITTLLSNEEIRQVCEMLGIADPPKHISKKPPDESVESIKKEFKDILIGKKEKYSDTTPDLLKETFQKKEDDKIYFDLNIGIAGRLDSYFHTIINPCKYGVIRFSKIFNYYWACYFTILRDVLSFLSNNKQEKFDKYLTNDADNTDKRELKYRDVLHNIKELTEALYNLDINAVMPENSYYRIIRLMLEKYKNEIVCEGVITTNYYRFCEIVSSNTIYLNGQLKFFEYPELLEVVDITKQKEHENKLLFPFIFGQSLVKPIVNAIQTEEFHKLNELLNNTDILVIMGFNINEDDNHINTFLHDYVKRGKKLIFVSENGISDVAKRLKCSASEVCVCTVRYGNNKEVVEKMFDAIIGNST